MSTAKTEGYGCAAALPPPFLLFYSFTPHTAAVLSSVSFPPSSNMSSKKAAPAKAPAKAAAKAPAKAAPAKPVRARKEKKPTQDLTIKTPLGIARGLKRGFPVTKRTRKIRTADVRVRPIPWTISEAFRWEILSAPRSIFSILFALMRGDAPCASVSAPSHSIIVMPTLAEDW